MTDTRESATAHDHVQTALELSCSVLMALELIRSRADEMGDADGQITRALFERAVETLRQVIAELRKA